LLLFLLLLVVVLAGGGVLAMGSVTGKEQQVTLIGDAAAFVAAVAVVIYLLVGKKLRFYQPIFVYAAPVTGWAALLLSVCGFLFEGRALIGADRHGIFAWVASARYAPWVIYLAIGPGIIGHTGLNTVLKYMSSLTVALAVQLEPMIGPCIGYALGVMAPPGVYTYAGGAVVLLATVWVSIASAKREAAEEREKQGYQAVATAEGRTGGEDMSSSSMRGALSNLHSDDKKGGRDVAVREVVNEMTVEECGEAIGRKRWERDPEGWGDETEGGSGGVTDDIEVYVSGQGRHRQRL
jgi:hypothetical protein